MVDAQHKALVLDSKFGNFVVQLVDTPKPSRGELLVKIEAVALNPVDYKIQKYGAVIENYPAIIGSDVAGTVEEVGEDVPNFSKGDRVFYQGSWSGNERGGYQQYGLADAVVTAKIPDHISFDEAATLPMSIAAPFIGFYNENPYGAGFASPLDPAGREKYSGKPLIIIGGSTSLGQTAIQLGKLSGFSPIIVTASSKHETFLKTIGATHVIDRNVPWASLAAEIANITTSPIEIVFDFISSEEAQRGGYGLLSPGGQFLTVLPICIEKQENSIMWMMGIWTLPQNLRLGTELCSKLTELLERGEILPQRLEVLPGGLNGVAGGIARHEVGTVSGIKLVVRPQETL